MHKPRADKENDEGRIRGRSALHQVLESVVKFQKSKVITGPSDSVGLMVWNIDVSECRVVDSYECLAISCLKNSSNIQSSKVTNTGNYKPGTLVYQNLRTINAEEIKKVIKLLEVADEEYAEAQESQKGKTTELKALMEAFPPCEESDELNIADVLVTCNFLFRDA